MKTALITGVTGQDGSYLSELLLGLGYRVAGMSRRVSLPNDARIKHLYANPNFQLRFGDVTDACSVLRIVNDVQPDEIYNLAAQSHVGLSFDQASLTTDATYLGALNCLEAIRCSGRAHEIRFYQASSSEMFGSARTWNGDGWNQDEDTPFMPNSPYAVAKLAAHHLVRVYRDSYGIFGCCGILFNHESPRRGEAFVTRKITKHLAKLVAAYLAGEPAPVLKLGNLDAYRDWGHTRDFVEAMHLMLQQGEALDYVIATGETHSVKEFLEQASSCVSLPCPFLIDPTLFRPCEVPMLKGDPRRAQAELGWKPKVSFVDLVHEMVYADVAATCGEHAAKEFVHD